MDEMAELLEIPKLVEMGDCVDGLVGWKFVYMPL